MQKFPIWFGGAQIFFSKASVLFQPRVLFFRRYQHFPATCSAAVFSDSTFSIHVVFCSSFFPTAQIFHSRVLQFFFSDGTNFPFTCSAVPFFPTAQIFQPRVLQFFPTAPKFSIHVFCSSFSPTAQIFQPRVASFKLADISTTCDVVYFSFHQSVYCSFSSVFISNSPSL